jgi:hypothetical protein
MNRYFREGFQRTFLNDLNHIEEQLQAYDEHLYLMWNPKTGEHLIVDGLLGLSVMKIPQRGFPALSSQVITHMKRIHTANGFSATQHIMKADAAREKEQNRQVEDLAQDFAKEAKDAFTNAYDYGITSGAKKYVQVGEIHDSRGDFRRSAAADRPRFDERTVEQQAQPVISTTLPGVSASG